MHIGQLIQQEMRSQGRTMSWLAQQLSCSETSVAMFLGKKSMDTGLLFTISEVIGVDFFRYYSEEIKSLKGAE